jgi:predicted RNA-binding protein (virulence factor B family)
MKDLLVPYNEQHKPMEVGKSYVVYVYLDESSDRIVASSKLGRHLQEKSVYHKVNQEVDILICGKSDMGYKAVVHNTHIGLIFRDDAFKPLRYGKSMKGYIKSIRPDGKIDLSLQLPAGLGRDDLSEQIIQHLENNDGRSKLTDKSAPDDIYHHFNVSKKNYKKALGTLYKQKRISIEADQIVLLAPQAAPQPQKDPPAKPAKQQTNTPASKATNKAITKPIKKPHNHTPKPSK